MPHEPEMKLRCKVGPYAGQVLSYPKHVGEHMLATGQAEWPDGKAPATAETATRPMPETRGGFPKKGGGGWFTLSDGSKVQGEEKAIAAEKELAG